MTASESTNNKREIDSLIEMIRANPFPTALPEARAAMDSLGSPVSADVEVEILTMGGVNCQLLTPANADRERITMYLHGGGYALGSLQSHGGLAAEIAKTAAGRVLQVDYRLAPEHRFPAPVEDACKVYRQLLAQGYAAEKISFAGDSAGGGLVIATMLALRESATPLPAAGVCLSPWIDLEFSGDSVESCQALDPIINLEVLSALVEAYMGEQNRKLPQASPLYADLSGFPPLLIQVGESEILLSDAERLAKNAQAAGVEVVFEKWPEMIHVWHLFYPLLTEGRNAIGKVGDFIRLHSGK